jgi:hypothetical protein
MELRLGLWGDPASPIDSRTIYVVDEHSLPNSISGNVAKECAYVTHTLLPSLRCCELMG